MGCSFTKQEAKKCKGTQKKEQRPKYAFMPKASPTESLKAQVPQGFTLLLFYKERSKEMQRNAKKCKEMQRNAKKHEKIQKRRRKNALKNNEMQKNMKKKNK